MASYKIVFNRKNKLNANNQASVSIEVYSNYKRKVFSTKVMLEPRFWDDKNKIVKNTHPDNFNLNKKISDKLDEIKSYETKCILLKKPFDIGIIGNRLHPNSFTQFFKTSIANRKLSINTSRCHNSCYQTFKDFAGEIDFNSLTYKLIFDYDNYLKKKGYESYTIHTKHKVLKTYINLAINHNMISFDNYPYRNFSLTKGKSNRIDLSFAQISELEKLKIEDSALSQVNDLFLFACYTGLRYEDVMDLRHKNIFYQKNNIELRKIILKTGDKIRLPLSYLFDAKAITILDKYKNFDEEKSFPQFTNQAINRLLKALAVLTSYKGVLTFHIARHTFGSRMAEVKPDPYLIQELMGHKDIKTSMEYIKTSSDVLDVKLKGISW